MKTRAYTMLCCWAMFAGLAPAAACAGWSFVVTDDARSSYAHDGADNAYPGDPGGKTSRFYDGKTRISPYYAQVAQAIAAEPTAIEFVLFLGDMAAAKKPKSSAAQFEANLKTWWAQTAPITDKGIPVYTVRGNHEVGIAGGADGNGNAADIWRTNSPIPAANPLTHDTRGEGTAYDQTGLSYAFTHKGCVFIGLDQYATTADGAANSDLGFLSSQLNQAADHRFVFTHQPVWNNATASLADDAVAMASAMNGKADMLFTGHLHNYQRITKDGYSFQELIVGTAGALQFAPVLSGDPSLHVQATIGGNTTSDQAPHMGYLLVTVNDDGTVTSQMKLLKDYTDFSKGVTSFDVATLPKPTTPVQSSNGALVALALLSAVALAAVVLIWRQRSRHRAPRTEMEGQDGQP